MLPLQPHRFQNNQGRCKPHNKLLRRRQLLEEVEVAEATEVAGLKRGVVERGVVDALALPKVFLEWHPMTHVARQALPLIS